MALAWEQVVVDAVDPEALAAWWREALGWVTVSEPGDEPELRPTADSLPGLLFVRVPEPKSVKDRLHLDFRPDDQAAEVARLEALGSRPSARRASTSARSTRRGWCSPTPRATSSACSARVTKADAPRVVGAPDVVHLS